MAKSKSAANYALAGPSKSEQQRWQAEEDLRTLLRAKEIERDAGRLARARKLAKEQLKTAQEATKL